MNEKRRRIFLIMAGFLMMLAFIAAFLLYTHWSRNHIREQNVDQAKENTLQTAATFSEMIVSSREEITVIANLYSAGAATEEDAEALFRAVVDSGIFDEFEATNEKGTAYGYAGRFAYVGGRDYFRAGMEGESGTIIVFGSYSGKTVILSYAPAVYDGTTRGVLFGMHEAQKSCGSIFNMTELNRQTQSYLCTADGYVFASSDAITPGTSVFYVEGMTDEVSTAVSECARSGRISTIELTNGMACGIVTPVEGTDWVLLQLYPDSCFTGRYRSATNGIVQLAFFLIVVFALYILFWLSFAHMENARLQAEISDVTSYRKAVTADAVILLQVNLNSDELTDGEWMDSHRHTHNLRQLLSLRLPCSYDSYIARWNENYVREESKALFAENTSRAFLMKSFAEGKPVVSFDYSARNLDGEDVYLRRTISMIRLEKTGEIVAYTSVKDITEQAAEQARYEQELTDAARRAEQLSGSAESFIEDTRRDVRLTAEAALSCMSLCYSDADRRGPIKNCLEQIGVISQHMLSVSEKPVGIGEDVPENVTDLTRLVKELGALLTPELTAKGLSFAGDFGSAYERVVLSRKLTLSRALLNLIGNLIQRSCSKGSLCCSVRQNPAGGENLVHTRFELSSCADLLPADETLKRQTLSGDGSPVGIAGKLIRDMGGTLSMTTDGGFRIELIMKIAAFRVENIDARLKNIEENNLNGARLLMVGMENGDGARIRENLTALGFEIQNVKNGAECLSVLNTSDGGCYRAVLLPMDRGSDDPYGLTRDLRNSANGRVPIIGMASVTSEEERHRAYASGMNAYLPTAIDGYALRAVIGTIL